jgi:histidyl-tRNA synthetase
VLVLVGDVYDRAQKVLASFREEGLRLAVDSTSRKTDAKLRSAAKAKVPFVIFIGEDELATGRFKLKNMASGEENELGLERLVGKIAPRHKTPEDAV